MYGKWYLYVPLYGKWYFTVVILWHCPGWVVTTGSGSTPNGSNMAVQMLGSSKRLGKERAEQAPALMHRELPSLGTGMACQTWFLQKRFQRLGSPGIAVSELAKLFTGDGTLATTLKPASTAVVFPW